MFASIFFTLKFFLLQLYLLQSPYIIAYQLHEYNFPLRTSLDDSLPQDDLSSSHQSQVEEQMAASPQEGPLPATPDFTQEASEGEIFQLFISRSKILFTFCSHSPPFMCQQMCISYENWNLHFEQDGV